MSTDSKVVLARALYGAALERDAALTQRDAARGLAAHLEAQLAQVATLCKSDWFMSHGDGDVTMRIVDADAIARILDPELAP